MGRNDAGSTNEAVREATAVELAALAFIRAYYAENGYPPSVREIGKAMGWSSSSTTWSHLKAMERAGLLEQRGPKRLWMEAS